MTHKVIYDIENENNKKHSENADTSTSLTFDIDVWPWPYFMIKKAYVVRCRLLHRALVPGMISGNVIVCDIWPFIHFLWPLTFTCDLQLMSRSIFTLISRCTLCSCILVPCMKFVGSIEFEIWTTVCWKLKWRHNDVITPSNHFKFKHKSTKGISKRQTEIPFDRT